MEWGVKANYYALLKAEKGREPPKEFLNPPQVHGHLIFYSDAFWRLHHDRPVNMAVGRIPWGVINEYAKRFELTGDDFDRFVSLIQAQDSEYLSLANRKRDGKGTEAAATDADAVKGVLARLAQRRQDMQEQSNRVTEADELDDDFDDDN